MKENSKVKSLAAVRYYSHTWIITSYNKMVFLFAANQNLFRKPSQILITAVWDP